MSPTKTSPKVGTPISSSKSSSQSFGTERYASTRMPSKPMFTQSLQVSMRKSDTVELNWSRSSSPPRSQFSIWDWTRAR